MYRAAVRPSLERACLAIADVSGYTSYLAGVELDHAQDILADLISTIVEAMAPFRLAKLEGDAAFTYLPGETLDGHMLQDTIEGAYVAFRWISSAMRPQTKGVAPSRRKIATHPSA